MFSVSASRAAAPGQHCPEGSAGQVDNALPTNPGLRFGAQEHRHKHRATQSPLRLRRRADDDIACHRDRIDDNGTGAEEHAVTQSAAPRNTGTNRYVRAPPNHAVVLDDCPGVDYAIVTCPMFCTNRQRVYLAAPSS
jgi:hypothetical protein